MGSDYGPAKWIPSSHFWAGRAGHQPRWIIVHGTAGGNSAEEIAYWFQTDNPPTSTHFVVGRDGEVVQCVNEANSAWGNGVVTQGHDSWWSPQLNPNFLTFSIEHVKTDSGNQEDLTQAQQEASFRLIDYLCDKYDIPKRAADASGGITGHYSIDPVNRSFCPGTYPWEALWVYLKGEEPVGVPSGWKDDGTRLTAPNGIPVVLGFRWYILTHPWSADDWPLEKEHYEATIDITNPQEGSGTVQHFRKSILGWQEHTSDILDLWSGSIALAWEQRALSNPKSQPPMPPLRIPVNVPVKGPSSTIANGGVQPPFAYPSGGGISPANPPASRRPMPATQQQGSPPNIFAAIGDMGSDDRISSLERQVQSLIDGLSSGKKPTNVAQTIQQDMEGMLGRPKIGRSPFSNPKVLLRWLLMLIGLLFSDVVAWAISAMIHHDTTLPLPFLTAGTVALSAVFFFLGIFRLQPK